MILLEAALLNQNSVAAAAAADSQWLRCEEQQ
jgi:hypothetical protein